MRKFRHKYKVLKVLLIDSVATQMDYFWFVKISQAHKLQIHQKLGEKLLLSFRASFNDDKS